MSIGKWIVVAFILFTLFIGTLVTVCVRQDISLVSKDYYKEELVYQEQLKRMNNTARLQDKPIVTVLGDAFIKVDYVDFDKVQHGNLKLFCPSNAEMDRNFVVRPSAESSQIFQLKDVKRGMYKAQLRWTMQGKEFFMEQVINL